MVRKGYAYVIQNERGRYFSEGTWDILGTPTTDGYDAFSWMAEQSWCNGTHTYTITRKIARYGQSHAYNRPFRSGIGCLADLPIKSGHRCCVDNDAALAFAVGFVFGHHRRC